MRPIAAAAAFLLTVHPGFAHTPVPGVGGFPGGLLHPLLVPAHALALLALGLLAGQQPPRGRRALFALFAVGLAAGLGAIVSALAVADADIGVLFCAATAGLLVALARPLPLAVIGATAAVTGAAMAFDSVPQEK
jgi:urease accessory protein